MEIYLRSEGRMLGMSAAAPAVEPANRTVPQVAPIADRADAADNREAPARIAVEDLVKVVEDIRSRLDFMGSRLSFSLDREANAIVVRLSDRQSGKLIKQFPAEAVLQLREKLRELSGLLFDGKA